MEIKLRIRSGATPYRRLLNSNIQQFKRGNHHPEEPQIQNVDPMDQKFTNHKCKENFEGLQ